MPVHSVLRHARVASVLFSMVVVAAAQGTDTVPAGIWSATTTSPEGTHHSTVELMDGATLRSIYDMGRNAGSWSAVRRS